MEDDHFFYVRVISHLYYRSESCATLLKICSTTFENFFKILYHVKNSAQVLYHTTFFFRMLVIDVDDCVQKDKDDVDLDIICLFDCCC